MHGDVKIHGAGPALSWAGDTDLGRVDILSPGEVGSGMGPRQLTEVMTFLRLSLLWFQVHVHQAIS